MSNPSKKPKPNFANSVFVNCPFDDGYTALFRALIFTIEYCGFAARSALEIDDAGETRAEKIVRLIRESRFGIHDISRTESNSEDLPRFNMPYEFGVFVGFKHSGEGKQRQKVLLVLDREKFRYRKFFSDIAGQDVHAHGDNPDVLIREVRNWLQAQTSRNLFGWVKIFEQFTLFREEMPHLLREIGKTEDDLQNYVDYRRLVNHWIELNT